MMWRGVRVSCSLIAESQQQVLRNVSAVVLKRCNSTAAVAQVRPEEWGYAKPFEDIPGPKPLPIIGNMWRFIPYIGNLSRIFEDPFHKLLHEKYGKIMKISGLPGGKNMLLLFDPDDIAKVFRNEGPWPIRDSLQCGRYYRAVERKDFFQGVFGLASTQGEEWHKFRTKVNQIMLQPRSTKLYVGPIDTVASDFIKRIRQIRGENLEMPADFSNELCKWGLECEYANRCGLEHYDDLRQYGREGSLVKSVNVQAIVFIALDTRLGCLEAKLAPDSDPQKMIDSVQVQIHSFYKLEYGIPIWKYVRTPTWKKFVKASDVFVEFSMKHINQAMERLKAMPEDSDKELTVLEKLLVRDPDPKIGVVMALDMMTAGIDTTSFSVAYVLYYLAKNPDKQRKLFEEIQRHVPDKDQPVTSDILNELRYLKACIKESMRMSAIAVGTTRETVKDMVIADYQVPKGTTMFMPLLMLSNLDKYYPQADKFIPERWIKEDPQYYKAHPFLTIPFGFGPRMCIGRRFAGLEIETLVTKVIRNFKVEYDYEMKYKHTLIRTPASPLKFRMIERESVEEAQ